LRVTLYRTHTCRRALPQRLRQPIYRGWLQRLRIVERFPQPDWSIADKWIAKELLQRGTPTARVATILHCGSPGFPRRHSNPEDYLHRTIARTTLELLAIP